MDVFKMIVFIFMTVTHQGKETVNPRRKIFVISTLIEIGRFDR